MERLMRDIGSLSYRHPADIDGEPDEVAAEALSELSDALRVAGEVAHGAIAQVRNAYMEGLDELSPEDILRWDDGTLEGRTLHKIVKSLEAARPAVSILASRRSAEL